MLKWFKNTFNKSIDIKLLIKTGATILDVRSQGEYASGHVKGSINIPLEQLSHNLDKLMKDRPVVACCTSGVRSASAKSMLKARGYQAYNGGSWLKINCYMIHSK